MESDQTRIDRDTLTSVLALFDAFRSVRHDMPLQHAYTFLLVAIQEGLGVVEYAERADVATSVMTRHLLDLGPHTRKREPGYGLVMMRMDPNDMRRHQTFLTPKGHALLHKVIRNMRAALPKR
jgi:DNA-binding MarR family transcriptional regulator